MPRVDVRNAWNKKDKRSRRTMWDVRSRVRERVRAGPVAGSDSAGDLDPPPLDHDEPPDVPDLVPVLQRQERISQSAAWDTVWRMRAQQMWTPDYSVQLEIEKLQVPDLRAQVAGLFASQVSTYRTRLTSPTLIERYDAKTERMIRDTTAVARRRRNQLDIPFSVFARSGSYMNQRVAERVWKDSQHGLRIVHRDTVMKLLDYMLLTEPAAPFMLNPWISVFGVDQCNMWQAAANTKKGHFRGAERINAQGMPVSIRSETVLNIVERQVPLTMAMLNGAEVQQIKEHGPYTEDWHNVLPLLDPRNVERDKWEWADSLMARVEARDAPPHQPEMPTTELEVVLRCLGKPRAKPSGPSPIKIHEPIPKCETQSFQDVVKMWARLLGHCTASVLCVIIYCDGQLVELLRTCKIRWPSEYKRLLIGNGFFHSFAHFCFVLIKGYWKVSNPCLNLRHHLTCSWGRVRTVLPLYVCRLAQKGQADLRAHERPPTR